MTSTKQGVHAAGGRSAGHPYAAFDAARHGLQHSATIGWPHEGQRDAANLLNGLRSAAETLFEQLDNPAAHNVLQRLLKELLLVLELRWKLEEQVLFPALAKAYCGSRGVFDHEQAELQALRNLAVALRTSQMPLRSTGPLASLEGLATLHFDDVAHLLARTRDDHQIDSIALGHEMQHLLAGWREDVRNTNDVEDEHADPLAQMPR